MKELNIEEKAKAYDNALEIAKGLYAKDAPDSLRLERMFPALKESEDERIVKELLTFFRESIHGGHILTNKEYNSWIAWLEKQGEQKPADKVEPSIFKDRLLELFQIFRWRCKDHILTNGEILEYVDAHIQELIGTMQKPADTEKGAKGNDREIPFSVWSEEDEDISVAIENHLREYYVEKKGYPYVADENSPEMKEYSWLKSLKNKVQPKQEWDEKDKYMLNNVIDTLKPLSQTTHSGYAINSMIDWLKSLKDRYIWKPSDEQMHYLSWVANVKLGDSIVEQEVSKHLNELLEDLKKLR